MFISADVAKRQSSASREIEVIKWIASLKQCSECKEILQRTEFGKQTGHADGLTSQCSKCRSLLAKQYQEKLVIVPKEGLKQCGHCRLSLSLDNFYKSKYNKDGFNNQCIQCSRVRGQKYREENKEKISVRAANYRERTKDLPGYREKGLAAVRKSYRKHREKNIAYAKQYNKEHAEELKAKQQTDEYKAQNRIRMARYGAKHREVLRERRRLYVANNRGKVTAYVRNRRKTDPAFRLRCLFSSKIAAALREQDSRKLGSILEHLPYTFKQLQEHIEKLWEPWMNWSNFGPASRIVRRWTTDHVIPQSVLPYDSMEHPNFLKCWDLKNLRPLDALENIEKGNKIIPELLEKFGLQI